MPNECYKERFTQIEARKYIRDRQKRGKSRLQAYYCDTCGFYHVTGNINYFNKGIVIPKKKSRANKSELCEI